MSERAQCGMSGRCQGPPGVRASGHTPTTMGTKLGMAAADERMRLVSRTWRPHQRLHVGNVAWSSAGGDGSPPPTEALSWGEPMFAFADVWRSPSPGDPCEVSVHISSEASPAQHGHVISDLINTTPHMSMEVSDQDVALVNVLGDAGFHRVSGEPWFAQLWRDIAQVNDLQPFVAPDGYSIRAVDDTNDDLARRVEVHREAWSPRRIKNLLGLEITGTENESSYSAVKQRRVMGSPDYRQELDIVVEAGDGSFAAYALGWLDEQHGAVLFEPVGTHPAHSRRGLARAVCSELLLRARDLGATQAVVGPRGDDGYPLPRRLYEGLGMREVAQFVNYTNVPD